MRKIGTALSIFAVLILLVISGCSAEPETITVNTTTTLTQFTTVTQTMASTVTMTSTVTSTVTNTQTSTSTSSTTASSSTTTSSSVEVIAESADGKLQIVSATLSKVSVAMYQVAGKVLNTSDQVLTARITVGFITDGGGLDQTQFTLVADIQPGQQKTFTVSSIDTFNNCTDFSILIEVWD